MGVCNGMSFKDIFGFLLRNFINADDYQNYQYILTLPGSPIYDDDDDDDAIDAKAPEIQRRQDLHDNLLLINLQARSKGPSLNELERLIWPKRTSGRA